MEFFFNKFISIIYLLGVLLLIIPAFINNNSNFNNFFPSFETLIQIRNVYFKERIYLWKICQELLRIDADTSHIYHSVVVPCVNQLLEK